MKMSNSNLAGKPLEKWRPPVTFKRVFVHTMKSREICRDIFGLAVRLMGLYFLYLGLRIVAPLLDLGVIETASKSDILNALLPIAFNLLVAWWLLGGGVLVRRAYPAEALKVSDRPPSPTERGTPPVDSPPPPALTGMDKAEKKLASLVEKPKDGCAV
jgi:hypothetical protein